MKLLIKLFFYLMLARSIILALFNINKVYRSILLYRSIKKSKTSDTVVILSAGKRFKEDSSFYGHDIFLNSTAYLNIDDYLKKQTKVVYLGRLEVQNIANQHIHRINDAKNKFQNSKILSEASSVYLNKETDFFGLRSIFLLPFKYPFLRPHNGPALLIWLAYCAGYKNIILDGVETTMIKGVILSRELYGDNPDLNKLKHTSSIASVSINNALMIYEYQLLFEIITKKVNVIQTSPSSWTQAYKSYQQVCAADDSWRNFLLKN